MPKPPSEVPSQIEEILKAAPTSGLSVDEVAKKVPDTKVGTVRRHLMEMARDGILNREWTYVHDGRQNVGAYRYTLAKRRRRA